MATPKKKSAPAKKKPASSKAATKRSQAPAKKQSSSRAAKSTKPAAAKKNAVHKHNNNSTPAAVLVAPKARERKLDPFTRAQKERLLQLRDAMVDSMAGVAQDTLRSRAEGSEASAFGMHQADAGSEHGGLPRMGALVSPA